jgi:hypothetical protein
MEFAMEEYAARRIEIKGFSPLPSMPEEDAPSLDHRTLRLKQSKMDTMGKLILSEVPRDAPEQLRDEIKAANIKIEELFKSMRPTSQGPKQNPEIVEHIICEEVLMKDRQLLASIDSSTTFSLMVMTNKESSATLSDIEQEDCDCEEELYICNRTDGTMTMPKFTYVAGGGPASMQKHDMLLQNCDHFSFEFGNKSAIESGTNKGTYKADKAEQINKTNKESSIISV